ATGISSSSVKNGVSKTETRAAASEASLSKNQINQLEKRIADIEKLIPHLESEAADLTAKMSEPVVAADFERLNALAAEHKALETRIQDLYNEWDKAAEELGG
ncbi:MAG: ABC transporter C-terminal domain-containing protein, partial [Pyrinomonadaceae bacterium]